MHDIVRVRLDEGFGDLYPDIQGVINWKSLSRHPRFERFALDVLHRDVARVVLFLNFINRADVGMIEGCRGLSFTQQTFASLFIAGMNSRQYLKGHSAF